MNQNYSGSSGEADTPPVGRITEHIKEKGHVDSIAPILRFLEKRQIDSMFYV